VAVLEIKNLHATYQLEGSEIRALQGVDFTIGEGEFFVLLGPSGCGKTTMLRSIAGLERPVAGEILIDGELVFSAERKIFVPPDQRPIAMVFQSYAIWPHMDVFENIAFPLRSGRVQLGDAEVNKRVGDVLDLLGLDGYAERPVTTLSGGQQQRVALARALALQPRILLMDEPLSNLDFKLQVRLRSQMRELMHQLNLTTVHVTHNQAEALETGDRIAVMDTGVSKQIGNPHAIYHRPESEFVARFIGDMNVFYGAVTEVNGEELLVSSGAGTLRAHTSGSRMAVGDKCAIGVRPEDLTISTGAGSGVGDEDVYTGRLQNSQFVGEAYVHDIVVGTEVLRVKMHHREGFNVGENVNISIPLACTIAVNPDASSEIADTGEDLISNAGATDKQEHGAYAR
jgi:iron(III) transport system ATP-binding protein